jgi:hypothetical protein
MQKKMFMLFVHALVLFVGLCPTIGAQDNDQAALAGKWRFNKEQSDDIQDKINAAIGGGGGIRGKMKRDRIQSALKQFSDAAKVLTLTIEGTKVMIQTNEQAPRILTTDGSKKTATTPRGKQLTTTALWREGRLIINSVTEEGAKFTQTYSLAGGQRRLQVDTRVETERLKAPLSIRSVYDPADKSTTGRKSE